MSSIDLSSLIGLLDHIERMDDDFIFTEGENSLLDYIIAKIYQEKGEINEDLCGFLIDEINYRTITTKCGCGTILKVANLRKNLTLMSITWVIPALICKCKQRWIDGVHFLYNNPQYLQSYVLSEGDMSLKIYSDKNDSETLAEAFPDWKTYSVEKSQLIIENPELFVCLFPKELKNKEYKEFIKNNKDILIKYDLELYVEIDSNVISTYLEKWSRIYNSESSHSDTFLIKDLVEKRSDSFIKKAIEWSCLSFFNSKMMSDLCGLSSSFKIFSSAYLHVGNYARVLTCDPDLLKALLGLPINESIDIDIIRNLVLEAMLDVESHMKKIYEINRKAAEYFVSRCYDRVIVPSDDPLWKCIPLSLTFENFDGKLVTKTMPNEDYRKVKYTEYIGNFALLQTFDIGTSYKIDEIFEILSGIMYHKKRYERE